MDELLGVRLRFRSASLSKNPRQPPTQFRAQFRFFVLMFGCLLVFLRQFQVAELQ